MKKTFFSMQKRDFFTKKNNDPYLYFFYSPFKEIVWWLIFFIKNILFHLSPKIFILFRNLHTKKTNSFAREMTSVVSKYYAHSNKPFHEIQIKNSTRTVNIFRETEKMTFELEGEKDFFLFGIAPLIEIYNLKKISNWTLKIQIIETSKILEQMELHFPLGENNTNNRIIYRANDGWIDLKLDLAGYKNKKVKIILSVELKKNKKYSFKESFCLSNPTFIKKKVDYKNIILLSIESLSDLNYLSYKYNLPKLPNFEKLMKISSSYSEVYSPIDATLTYAGSIFSGLMPSQHGLGDYSISPDSYDNEILNKNIKLLSEQIKCKGFINFFGGTAPRLNSKTGFTRGFDDYFQVNKNYFANRPKMNLILNGLHSFKGFDKFFFLHLDCLHEPYLSLLDDKKPLSHDVSFLKKENKKFNIEGYMNGLEEIDRELGYLINYLNNNDEMDKTMIFLTGDHGNGINWEKGMEYTLYDERLRVPLIIKYPTWVESNNENNSIPVSSVFEIHRILNSALNIKYTDEIMKLPQYSNDFKEYVFSEVIMMPKKDRKRHSLSVIYKDYKYVCANEIDWENFQVKKKLGDCLYKRDQATRFFNEEEDIASKENDQLIKLRNIAYEVIEINLKFNKKYPASRY